MHILYSQYDVAIEVLYLWAVTFAKLSILLLYATIFGQANLVFRRGCQLLGAIIIAYCIICTPLYIFSCLPSGARSLEQFAARQCVNPVPLSIGVGALNIATDTVLIILPLPLLAKLQMTRRKKLALMGVFGTGALYGITFHTSLLFGTG